jgi:hypothetical protein
MYSGRALAALLTVITLLPACSGGAAGRAPETGVREAPPAEPSWTEMLPESIGTTGWTRKPDVAVFVGDSLFAYIDGAAEMYLKYGFVDLHAAEYCKGDAVITADLYRFASSDLAFGMYAAIRPDRPDTVRLGIEGFAFDTNWVYVKGPYLVNVYTYDDIGMDEVRAVASAIERGLPGTLDKPEAFGLFPEEDRIAFSEKFQTEAFLSQAALSDVYSIDYEWDGHRFTLFLSDDPGSAKLEAWRASAQEEYDPDMGYQHLPYDGSRYLHTSDSYRGEIIAGPVGGRLVGMVGYRPEDVQILLAWLHNLTEQH